MTADSCIKVLCLFHLNRWKNVIFQCSCDIKKKKKKTVMKRCYQIRYAHLLCPKQTRFGRWFLWKTIRCHGPVCWMTHSIASYLQDLITAAYRPILIKWELKIAAAQMPTPQLGSAICFMNSVQLKWWNPGNSLWILSPFSFHSI